MNLAPTIFKPGALELLNGDLAEGIHASDLDTFATWLAVQRPPIPPNIGAPMNNFSEYKETIHVPQFCEHIGFSLFCAGSGDVDISCSDDSYGCRVYVQSPGTTRDKGEWYHVTTPLTGSGATTSLNQRALALDDDYAPHTVTVTYSVPSGVYVWEVVPRFLPRSVDSPLPSSIVAYFASSVPVGYWSMDDGTGSTVSDISSAGNNLDGTKASAVSGQPLWDTSSKVLGGASLQFDQADTDAVIVPDDDVLDFSTDDAFSISCWVKRSTSYSGNVAGLVTKSAASSTVDSPFEGYALWFNDTEQRRPSFLLYRQVSGTEQLRVQADALAFADSDTDWHHILVTYDGSSDLSGVTMYIDGTSVAISLATSDTLPPGTDITTATDLCFGGFINNASTNSRIYPFAGNLDEVAIWSKELSSAEAAAVYNGGIARTLVNGIRSN